MTTSLTTRIPACIAWLRERRAAGTQGRWSSDVDGIHAPVTGHCRMCSYSPRVCDIPQCHDAALIAASVNLSEEMCRLVEGLLFVYEELAKARNKIEVGWSLVSLQRDVLEELLTNFATAVEAEMEAQGGK